MRRVLVTGSRNWTDPLSVEAALLGELREHGPITVVHGDCLTGADRTAAHWAETMKTCGGAVEVEPHPVDWRAGKGAGPRRNAAMVALGADVCLAFIRDNSRGATHCASLAHEAGIPTHVYRWEGDR